MKKSYIKWPIVIILFVLTAALLLKITRVIKHKEQAKLAYQEIPQFAFYDLSGNRFSEDQLNGGFPTLILLFNTQCEHCWYETQAITEHIDDFKNANIIMVSAESQEKLILFKKEFELDNFKNINILQDKEDSFYKIFGTQMILSIFIYGKEGKLKASFKGEVDIKTILKHINE